MGRMGRMKEVGDGKLLAKNKVGFTQIWSDLIGRS